MARCAAKSKRSGQQCKNWAIRKKSTCRFHGGLSCGPKTKKGKKILKEAHLKHGMYSKEVLQEKKRIRQLIKGSMNYLGTFS